MTDIRVVQEGDAIGGELTAKLSYIGLNNIFLRMDQRIEAEGEIDGAICHGIERSAIINVISDV